MDPVVSMRVDRGLVTGLYFMRNPDMLGRLGAVATLVRDPSRRVVWRT